MNKISVIVTLGIASCMIFFLGFYSQKKDTPKTYYQVYLDEKVIGVVDSKKKLEKYIDDRGDYIKKKYGTDKVFAPEGLEIKKITTYHNKVDKEKDIYEEIMKSKPFTIMGYQLRIHDDNNNILVYATKENIFREALQNVIEIFTGKDRYQSYVNETQKQIETTGSYLENVYIANDKTIKQMKIPVDEQIYTDSETLSKFLLFGTNEQQKIYKVQAGDTITKVSFNHKISTDEFLISNPTFTSANNLLSPGQEVIIGITSPKVKVVVQEHIVEDKVSQFKTDEQIDPDRLIGDDLVVQAGENGLERVSQTVESINGVTTYIQPTGREVLKPVVNRVIIKGGKYVPSIGSLTDWAWPTNSAYSICSYYEYRFNPISGLRELHDGLDICGFPIGSPVYAANNGTVTIASYTDINGYYIHIDHGNGYQTQYAHMSQLLVKQGQVVAKGQQIGKIGDTGWATGPHLHFAVAKGVIYRGGYFFNPFELY